MPYLFLTAAAAVIDQGLKDLVEHTEDDAFPREYPGRNGPVAIYKSHNPGLPFGWLSEFPQLVREIPLATASAAAGILLWLLPRKGSRMQKLGLALSVGGAASNLYDRFARGYVVDYLNIRAGKLGKVIFNLGDVCILVGSALFFLGEMIAEVRGKHEHAADVRTRKEKRRT